MTNLRFPIILITLRPSIENNTNCCPQSMSDLRTCPTIFPSAWDNAHLATMACGDGITFLNNRLCFFLNFVWLIAFMQRRHPSCK